MAEKHCRLCRVSKDMSLFGNCKSSKDGKQSYCKTCSNNKAKLSYKNNEIRRESFKNSSKLAKAYCSKFIDEVKSFNKCCVCREDDPVCLDFHHIDPSAKLECVSRLASLKNRQAVIDEIRKCTVLCSNCHRKFHAGKICASKFVAIVLCEKSTNDFVLRKIRNDKVDRTRYPKPVYRKIDNKKVLVPKDTPKQKYQQQTKIDWPSKEELAVLVWEKPTATIAKEFGVADSSVAKWVKKYGLSKPPRGYWQKMKYTSEC